MNRNTRNHPATTTAGSVPRVRANGSTIASPETQITSLRREIDRPQRSQGNAGEPFYVASSLRVKFHRPSCEWASYVSERYALTFDSREEAIATGRKPCGTCCA